MDPYIRIRGARQHNLKDIDLDLPRRALTVVTGPSGSGKSSLALDTLFAEGQRRYVESLSTYAKQFLDRMEKPHVDRIDGVAPAVAIEQKNPTKTSRSTVGTATEIFDFMRLLWSRVGRTHCPVCDREVRPDSVSGATDRILALDAGTRIQVTFPLRLSEKVSHRQVVENLGALGFVRVLADGDLFDLGVVDADSPETLGIDLTEVREILVVVDRLTVSREIRDRLADSLGTCFVEGEGECVVLEGKDGMVRHSFTEHFRCPDHPEVEFLEPRPQLFSFNSPYGSCPLCTGFGATLDYDLDLIVPNPARSLDDGAVDPWSKPRYHKEREKLSRFAASRGVSTRTPWAELPEDFRKAVLYGAEKFQGMVPFLVSREKKRYKQYIRVFLRQYQSPKRCKECGGAKLRKESLYIRVGDATIAEVGEMPLERLAGWVDALELSEMESQIAETILHELRARISFVIEVGLGYLSMNRQTRTLSGGEAQRINLANSLGAKLVDTLYVLDEPTVGLHPRDTDALLRILSRLRDGGNTVVMVEHDAAAIRSADHVVELGPASGEQGGEVVFEGTPDGLERAETVTGLFLSGRETIEVPERRRSLDRGTLELVGATLHNVSEVNVDIPLGAFTVVTGVSGSGKSTLVHDVLFRALESELSGGETSAKEHLGEEVGDYRSLKGIGYLTDVVRVDQSPIGRTPRSNPVTYIKAWNEVRRIFAEQPLARQRGFTAKHFSFNTKGGRCDVCDGAGHVEVEMVFIADVYVPCEQCGGKRYKAEVLEVEFKEMSVADVLDMTVDEAIRFFLREGKLGRTLWHLQKVGLGYLRLGQPANTLSGGESQRLKIARELSGSAGKKGRKIYLLDEPTTGLSGNDVSKLIHVLEQLVDAGHTVVVIEHHLDVIKMADWVIDMGPEAGDGGGRVVAMGRPEDVAKTPESWTGRYLKEVV